MLITIREIVLGNVDDLILGFKPTLRWSSFFKKRAVAMLYFFVYCSDNVTVMYFDCNNRIELESELESC